MREGAYLLRGGWQRGRYALGAASLVVSTTIMIAIGVVFAGGQAEFRSFFERAYAYDFEIARARETLNASLLNVSEVGEAVRGVGGVEGVYPLLATVLFTIPDGNSTVTPLVVYGTTGDYRAGKQKGLQGSYDLSPGKAVLSRKAAGRLGLGVGGRLGLRQLLGPSPANLSLNITGVAELEGRFPPGVEEYAITGIDFLAERLNLTGLATSVLVTVDSSLYDLSDPSDPARGVREVGKRIALRLGPGYTVTSMKSYIIEQSVQGTSFFGIMVYVFSAFFPAVAGIMVASVLNLSVEDRAHDLAVLRLLGARRSAVAGVVLWELGLIVLLGLPAGVALGVALPFAFAGSVLAGARASSIASTVAAQVAISLAVLLLFSFQPMRRALRSSPIDAVRRSRPLGELRFRADGGLDRRIPLAGLVLFVAVAYSTLAIPYILIFSSGMEILFYLLVSVMVMLVCLSVAALGVSTRLETGMIALVAPLTARVNRLARKSVLRYARRNLSTNIIFGVVVAILIFFTSLISTVRGSIEDTARYEAGADIRVRSAYDMPESQLEALLATPGVERGAGVGPPVDAELGALVGPSGVRVRLYAADSSFPAASYLSSADFRQGDPTAFGLDNSSIIISRSLATALNAGAGDVIRASREDRRSLLTVRAVLNTLPGFPFEVSQTARAVDETQAAFVSFEQHRFLSNQSAPARYYSSVFLRVSPGKDPEKVGEELLLRFSDRQGVRVSVTKATVRSVTEATAFLDVIFSSVLLGMMMVAVFSLMSNLYASIKEREFEIGVLRSLGFRRTQILGSFLLEGVAVALGAVLLGILVGLVVGLMMVWFIGLLSVTGLRFVVPWHIIALVLGVTLVSSVLGILLTSRQVVRRELIELVRRAE
ncbi:MAG: FtsX-like permease family protein [Thermoplasmata archaeon]